MDYLQQNIRSLLPIVDSIIRREVDCSIDDLLEAKNIIVKSESFPFEVNNFFAEIKKDKRQEKSTANSLQRTKKRNLLLCISKEGEDLSFIQIARELRNEGFQIVTITANRSSTLATISNRVIGIDLNIKRENKELTNLLYEQTIYILLNTIKQSLRRRIPISA